jgi:hypothetical protein
MTPAEADAYLARVREDHAALAQWWRERSPTAPFPGRAEALLALARALGRPLPAAEYVLPEHTLAWLLERAQKIQGRKVPLRGAAGHKGRVGDGVERLLVGNKVAGRTSDHPAAEIKSVPVAGELVVERVKLGVLSPTSNPLDKCDCILFVFVEARGQDFFVVGHHAQTFDFETWKQMWVEHWIVETAAGSPRQPARGLYLVPRWFRAQGIWPPRR